jgi:hypothetical protein
VKAEDSAGAQFRAMYTPQYIGPAHAYGGVVLRKLVSSKVHPRLRMFPKQQLLALAGESEDTKYPSYTTTWSNLIDDWKRGIERNQSAGKKGLV